MEVNETGEGVREGVRTINYKTGCTWLVMGMGCLLRGGFQGLGFSMAWKTFWRFFHGMENRRGGAAGKSHAKAQRAQREEKGGKKLEIYHESHENHEKSGENGPKMAK